MTLPAGGARSADFPFAGVSQSVRVFAYLGRDRNAATGVDTLIGTGDRPLKDIIIDLYATESAAIAAGTAGRLGRDTTDAAGRPSSPSCGRADTSPGSGPGSDQIVFAQIVTPRPAPYVLNGETRIEIRYDPRRNPTSRPTPSTC